MWCVARSDKIETGILEWQDFGGTLKKNDVGVIFFSCTLAGLLEHLCCHVQSHIRNNEQCTRANAVLPVAGSVPSCAGIELLLA
jgi:hypothetical protein